MNETAPDVPQWTEGSGPEADIVLSTRARLARCLRDFPFPHRASEEQLAEVVRLVRAAGAPLTERFPALKAVDVDSIDQEQRAFLLDAHVASLEQLSGGPGRAVIMEPRALLSIMVNEEDHLRVQSLHSGLAPEDAWSLADWADDVLSANLDFGYSQRYGYLTSSVSNVGTGLRVSALMHLAGLSRSGRAGSHLRAAYDLGVSVRGLFGEGTRPVGDLFQVSNEVTLGISEREIVERVRSVAGFLLDEERRSRKELLADQRMRLIEEAGKALHQLKHSRALVSSKALVLMSTVRLAAELGLLNNCPRSAMNEVFTGLGAGVEETGRSAIDRAELTRNKLANCTVAG